MQHLKVWRELTEKYVPRRLHTEHLKPPSRRFTEAAETVLKGRPVEPKPPCSWKYASILPDAIFPHRPATHAEVESEIDRICSNPKGGNIIWTDASATQLQKRKDTPVIATAGATVYWDIQRRRDGRNTITPLTQTFTIEQTVTVAEAETLALCAAVHRAPSSTKITIFSDSMAALYAARGHNITTPAAMELHSLLADKPHIRLAHCPAHKGLEGNEAAHSAAAAEAKRHLNALARRPGKPATITHAKHMELIRGHYLATYEKAEHPFFTYQHSFKHIQVLCRLYTGACKLNQYLHRIGKRPSPYCDHCPGIEESVEHFVEQCPKWNAYRGEIRKNKTPEALADFAFKTGREL